MGQFPSESFDDLRSTYQFDFRYFEKWLSSSHLNHFMDNMFDIQPRMILSLPRFPMTEHYGLFSKGALEWLMVLIFPSLHPLLCKVSTGIKKGFFHRIVSAYVTLICNSHILYNFIQFISHASHSLLKVMKCHACPMSHRAGDEFASGNVTSWKKS